MVAVNDPPVWNLPRELDFRNLSVRFDVDHPVLYWPFVFDVDNSLEDLRLVTNDPEHAFASAGSPLTLILRYDESFDGTTQRLSLWVTDGTANSTVLSLNVAVSDNYPPALIQPLPKEIVLDEGETRENALNLLDYFRDRDGVLFFAFGAQNVHVEISNETGAVNLSSPSDWSGTEQIVLRAQDDRGAFQDGVILITVLSVDDPPRLAYIPDFVFDAGKFYVVLLLPYASDADTPTDQLTFTATTSYPNASVSVFGANLQVIYPEYEGAPGFDALTVCVSDGGDRPACRNVAVRVHHVVQESFDWLQFFFFMGAVAVSSIISARHFFEFRVRRPPTVEDVFLVYDDGILIKHYSKQVRKFADDDVVTSMLSAIQSFAADSFEDTENWELREIAFHGRKILIERARKFQIFVIFDGDSNDDLKREVRRSADAIDRTYEKHLRDWDGDPSHFDGAEVHFENLLAMQQAFVPKGVTADGLRRTPLVPGVAFVSETGDFSPLIAEYSVELKGIAAIRLRPQGDAGVPVEGLEAEEVILVEIPPPTGVPGDDDSPHNGLDVALVALKDALEEAHVTVHNRPPVVLFEGFDFVVDRYGFVFSKKFSDQLKRMAKEDDYVLFIAVNPLALSINQLDALERDAVVVRGDQ